MVIRVLVSNRKRIRIDTKKDTCIYEAPVNPPNTGTRFLSGCDLYKHTTKNNNDYFYFHHWSMWQGSNDRYELIDRDEAINFLIEKSSYSGHGGIDEDEMERISAIFGEDIFAEDDDA